MPRDRLVIVQLDAVHLKGDVVTLSAKTLRALELYANHWPGEVVVSVEVKQLPSSLLLAERRLDGLPFTLADRARTRVADLRKGAAVSLAMHDIHDPGLIDLDPRRLVLYGEIPLAERIRMAQLGSGTVRRLRVAAGWHRRARALQSMARRAGGFQANGYPVHSEYGPLSRSSIVYFDTRAGRKFTEATMPAHGRTRKDRPFTVAFSGRHTAAKGPEFALDAVTTLLRDGADIRLVYYGDGELTPKLRELAAPWGDRIEFRGEVDFESHWVHELPRTADLMILPHVQGDPSGTYLESAAVGVPVLGFDNVALESLCARHGIGWTVPLGNAAALATRLRQLMEDPSSVRLASEQGRSFMRKHPFEEEFARRVHHLRQIAQV